MDDVGVVVRVLTVLAFGVVDVVGVLMLSVTGTHAATLVAVWRRGNIVGRINEVTLRRVRLVLGWVTVFGG